MNRPMSLSIDILDYTEYQKNRIGTMECNYFLQRQKFQRKKEIMKITATHTDYILEQKQWNEKKQFLKTSRFSNQQLGFTNVSTER